jgi:hypothetical protein
MTRIDPLGEAILRILDARDLAPSNLFSVTFSVEAETTKAFEKPERNETLERSLERAERERAYEEAFLRIETAENETRDVIVGRGFKLNRSVADSRWTVVGTGVPSSSETDQDGNSRKRTLAPPKTIATPDADVLAFIEAMKNGESVVLAGGRKGLTAHEKIALTDPSAAGLPPRFILESAEALTWPEIGENDEVILRKEANVALLVIAGPADGARRERTELLLPWAVNAHISSFITNHEEAP